MAYDPYKHHRRSIRLKGYDYSQPGFYFITICAQDRTRLFGAVVKGEMVLNEAGIMIDTTWCNLPERFPTLALDVHMVMPNHFHATCAIQEAELGQTAVALGR